MPFDIIMKPSSYQFNKGSKGQLHKVKQSDKRVGKDFFLSQKQRFDLNGCPWIQEATHTVWSCWCVAKPSPVSTKQSLSQMKNRLHILQTKMWLHPGLNPALCFKTTMPGTESIELFFNQLKMYLSNSLTGFKTDLKVGQKLQTNVWTRFVKTHRTLL